MEPAFDDGLSEDWISQPGSSDVSVLRDDSSFLSKSIRGSRIPLPKSQSTSSLPQRTSGRALVEKPASALNVGGSRSARVLSGKQQRERRTSVSSAEELGSVRRRSIQNGERGGDGAQHTTPEWKRRLLNSRGAASKQQGLFSSIGLENMFRPPTVRKEAVARPRGAKSSAPPTSVPPSSPPVLPNRDLQSISLSSPDESMQLPPVPMPPQNRMASMRQLSKARSRVVSGKSYLQHESFSPIQLASSLAMRKDEWPTLDGSSSASHHANGEQYRPTSSRSDSALELSGSQLLPRQQRPELDTTSISLPDDIEAETGCHPFVTMTRGGFSAEGSFQRRPLSPSSFQQQSMSAQNQSDTSKVLLSAPQTPRINTKARGGNDETRSSGSPNKRSPLKLFDKYDTFTNDRLSRRITQFEVRSNKSPTVDAPSEAEHRSSPSPVRTQPSLQSRTSSTQQRKTRMSSFGEGMLNQFNFTHEEKDHGLPRWPGREGLVVESDPAPLQRQTDTFESGVSESEGAYQNAQPSNRYPKGEVRGDIPLGEGKRLRSSPQKIPNAKRRRTINEEATEITGIQLQRQRPSISQNNSMAGKKRKDARYDNSDQTADPQIIATRHMLHPKARQHSGSRSSRQVSIARTAKTDETGEPFIDLEVATGVLAGELANLALNVAKDISQGERKKSVTTADFFHEANLIMQNLRLNATQNNNYENSPILESSRLQGIEESAAVFSTDNFSRPPSTEGSPLRRRVPGPKDFRIISRLRKFEDTDDIGLAINSSFQGLQKHEQAEGGTSDLDDSELSNIRILDPPRQKAPTGPAIRKKDGSIGTAKETESAKYPSSKSSSGRSVHTGSSGTGTKAVIPPDRVQHLIRNNMGRMTFDHEKNCWIKRKSSADQISAGDRLDSEVTEDDPFREIPDLDVDVSQELKTVLAVASRSGSLESSDKKQPAHSDSRPTLTRHEDIQQSFDRGTHLFTEKTQDVSNKSAGAGDESSEPVALETDRQRTAAAEDALMRGEVAEVSTPLEGNRRQARAVTVAFSSPLVQPAPVPSGNHDGEASDLELDADHLPEAQFDSAAPSQRRNRSILRSIKAVSKTASSSVRQFKASRALSRIDEGEKTSSPLQNAENTRSDLAVTLATPQVMVKKADGPLSILNSAKSYVPMQLTPLSDFTVHHADESLNLDVQYLAKRRGLASLQEIEGRFSLSIKDLVEKIADVEPYEPYWEHMRALRLQGRGLLTLHMLDDFCSRIEELDVSSNELGQLNGAPDTLRVLNAQKNCLSSLTAWGHLQNLQYVDISDNEIDSLAGFRELVHVRELKAEHNQIDSLDGVLHLNGLLKLKLKGNRVKAMDCRESDLYVEYALRL